MQINQHFFPLNTLYNSKNTGSKVNSCNVRFAGNQDTVTVNSEKDNPAVDLKERNKSLEKKVKELALENTQLKKENLQYKESQRQQEIRLKSLEKTGKKIRMQ